MRVLFWGTPEFATAPLRALLGEGFDVVGGRHAAGQAGGPLALQRCARRR